MSNMLNIVLFGPPGAGKGTQSQKLIDKYNLTHLSTGDILRSEIARGTTLGMEAKQIMDRGDLVSDDIVIGMIEAKIDADPYSKGFVFDGFPRTQAQAVALDDLLQKKGTAISAMLALEVENEELIKRLLIRGKESGRPDDQNEDIIRNRVNEYNNKTLPLKKYYSEQAKFHSINGIGSIDSIFNDICERLVFINAEIELTMLENDIEHLDLTINDFEVATEISEELKKDIESVRKTESKKETPKVSVAKKTVAKPAPSKAKKASTKPAVAKKATAKKKTSAKPAKTVTKSTKKKAIAKKVIKKAVKKATPKKVVKKVVAKKIVKKVTPKKVVKKATPKKVVKKVAPKKIVKKAAPKKAVKKVVSKKPIKKVVKKIAPKASTGSATKAVKKITKKKK